MSREEFPAPPGLEMLSEEQTDRQSEGSQGSLSTPAAEKSAIKRKRTSFTHVQLLALETVFQKNRTPELAVRASLAEQMGLDEITVQYWFQNRRQRQQQVNKQRRECAMQTPSAITGRPSPLAQPYSTGTPPMWGMPSHGAAYFGERGFPWHPGMVMVPNPNMLPDSEAYMHAHSVSSPLPQSYSPVNRGVKGFAASCGPNSQKCYRCCACMASMGGTFKSLERIIPGAQGKGPGEILEKTVAYIRSVQTCVNTGCGLSSGPLPPPPPVSLSAQRGPLPPPPSHSPFPSVGGNRPDMTGHPSHTEPGEKDMIVNLQALQDSHSEQAQQQQHENQIQGPQWRMSTGPPSPQHLLWPVAQGDRSQHVQRLASPPQAHDLERQLPDHLGEEEHNQTLPHEEGDDLRIEHPAETQESNSTSDENE